MPFTNPFTYKVEDYKRNMDIIGTAVSDAAYYIHKTTGRDLDYCIEWVKKSVGKGGKFQVHDPDAMVLSKESPGNRSIIVKPFSKYLGDVVKQELMLSPSMAVYQNPRVQKSILSLYSSGNVKKRGISKKAMFVAKGKGDATLARFKDNEQSTYKIKNNSMSGAHASPYTPLYNKSAHSTLTSICRCASGYGNANNEKFIMGNRHYHSPRIALNNVLSIIGKTDLQRFAAVMEKYGIVTPTAQDVMDCITYSSNQYWGCDTALGHIRALVESISPIERAAFCYTGDMYHLGKHNPEFVRAFLDDFSARADVPISVEETDALLKAQSSTKAAYIYLLCSDVMRGDAVDAVRAEPDRYGILGATILRTNSVLDKYRDLISTFWTTDNMPASIFYLPQSIRKSAITSDTDSTIFTVQYWTKWFCGDESFSLKSRAVANTVVYMTSEMITHLLGLLSANIGAVGEDVHLLKMKPEYSFPVFSLTSRAKHYYAYIDAREGNLYKDLDTEIKGVALRSSNSPKHIVEEAHRMIKDGMDKVLAGKKIDPVAVLRRVAAIEMDIIESVKRGDPRYMKSGQIKPPESYVAGEDASTYRHYLMWQSVFAPKYGQCEPPTYRYVKVPIRCNSKTELNAWLDAIEDQALRTRLKDWFESEGKVSMKSLYLPESIVAANDIPPEIVAAANIRQLVAQTMEPFYLILESYNLFFVDDKRTKLVSDFYH